MINGKNRMLKLNINVNHLECLKNTCQKFLLALAYGWDWSSKFGGLN